MTPKQQKFCLEYSISANATQAAINAGYSKKSAYSIGQENLKKPEIKNELQRIAEEMASAKIASAREIQETLTAILRQELDEEVIVVEGLGEGVSEAVTKTKKPAIRDAIKAGETLAKMQGLFDNTTNLNIIVPVFGGEDDLEE